MVTTNLLTILYIANSIQGHYCLAEAYRDSLPPPPFEMPPALAIQTIGSAIHHFSEAFKLSRDKQAFYECILIAVPAGQFIPHTYVLTNVCKLTYLCCMFAMSLCMTLCDALIKLFCFITYITL